MTKVFNTEKINEELEYSCSPKEAVVCAYEQNVKKNFNALDYDYSQAIEGKFGWICGDYWARKEQLIKADLKIDMPVYHRNRKQSGKVTHLDTGDDTSCVIMFEDGDEAEVSVHLLNPSI